MGERIHTKQGHGTLRNQVDKRLAGQDNLPMDEGEMLRLVHELQVHQLELEMQGEELRKAKELLEASHETLFTELYEFAPVGYCTLDRKGSIRRLNFAAAQLFGEARSQLLGRRLENLVIPESRPSFCALLDKVSQGGKKESCEVTFSAPKTTSPIVTELEASVSEDGKEYRIAIVDITARRIAETQRAELVVALRQSQKMEAIGTLAGGIAHDFNNILGTMLGYTEITLMDEQLTEDARSNLQEILTAAKRARELIKQILLFSRKVEQKKESLDLHLIVEEAAKLLAQAIPTTITIKTDLDPCTGTILADENQIHQIIMNLGANAYHSMSNEGGTLDIRLEPILVNKSMVLKYPDLKEGPFALLTICDNGVGIDPETLSHIFEPFYTTKRVGEGTGLGLSVVHGIVKNHGGSINVVSHPGAGTTFKIFLPLLRQEPALAQQTWLPLGTKQSDQAPRGSEHILLVDDEPKLLDVLEKTLKSLGYQVTAASSSQAALDIFRSAPEKFQLLLTDLAMPGGTGDSLAKEVCQIRPGLPVIICTGHSGLLDETKAKNIGIDFLLHKPFDRYLLARVLRQVLEKNANQPLPPEKEL